VIANGPIRLVFELDYAPFQAGGGRLAETKRVTLDAGSMFNRFESTFTPKRTGLAVALGIAKHPGATVTTDPVTASMRVWEPVEGANGNLACAIVLAPGNGGMEKQTDDNYLFVTPAKPGEPLVYYVGSAWDRAGHVQTADAWGEAVRQLSVRLASPIKVALGAGPGAAPAIAPPAPAPAPAAPAPAPAPGGPPSLTPAAPAPAAPSPVPVAPPPAKPGGPSLAPPPPATTPPSMAAPAPAPTPAPAPAGAKPPTMAPIAPPK
jgi:hypothetical protein